MSDEVRRKLLRSTAGLALTLPRMSLATSPVPTTQPPAANTKKDFVRMLNEGWVAESNRAIARAKEEEKRGVFSSLAPPEQLVPFKDWDYYYTKGMRARWSPNKGQPYKAVDVPSGFVTDLTSIPQIFWSSGLRPEGPYAYAAVVHDYLYWTQDRPIDEADEIFLFAMEDSKVETSLRNRIYNAVKLGGGSSWKKNAALKKAGERRLLKQYPSDFTITWAEWKKTPGVFQD